MLRSIFFGFFIALVGLNCFRSNSLVKAQPANSDINNKPHTVVVAGGWDQGPLRSVELLNLITQTFTNGKDMIMKRSDAGYAVFNGQLYVVGGRIEGDGRYQDTPKMETYNAENDAWTEGTNMGKSRSRLGLAALNSHLYAIGGFDGNSPLDTVEQYDPNTGEWGFSRSLILKTEMFGLAVVNNSIFVIGGRDEGGSMNRVQRYNSNTQTWSFIADMSQKRVAPGVGVLSDRIYVLGGLSGTYDTDFLNSVEYYDKNLNKWISSSSMPEQRAFFGVVPYYKKLYLIGGKNNTIHDMTTTQVFDVSTCSYFYISSRMQQGRAGHVTALI